MAQLEVGELAAGGVGDERGDPVPVDVSDAQLGAGVPAFLADDQPLLGLWAAISQETLAGVLMPEETIDREAALRIWTINNALATGEQHLKGTIESGKFADLTALCGDPLTVPDADFLSLQVCQTLVGGQTIYER